MRIDEIIDPATTRAVLAADLARLSTRRVPPPEQRPLVVLADVLSPAGAAPGPQSVDEAAPRGSASAGASILGTKWAINVATAATPMMMSARQ